MNPNIRPGTVTIHWKKSGPATYPATIIPLAITDREAVLITSNETGEIIWDREGWQTDFETVRGLIMTAKKLFPY